MSKAQTKKLEERDRNNQSLAADEKPTGRTLGAPAQGGLQANGNDNAFWWDAGKRVAQIRGEYRSSGIVETCTGRIPAGMWRTGKASNTTHCALKASQKHDLSRIG